LVYLTRLVLDTQFAERMILTIKIIM